MERTYVMLKPDAVKRNLVGEIISRIEKKGYTITRLEMMTLTSDKIKEHYPHHLGKAFYPGLEEFMISGPVVAMIVEGEEVMRGMRMLTGPTKWFDALPGTIRGDYANGDDLSANLLHSSDSLEAVEEEIKRFFN